MLRVLREAYMYMYVTYVNESSSCELYAGFGLMKLVVLV